MSTASRWHNGQIVSENKRPPFPAASLEEKSEKNWLDHHDLRPDLDAPVEIDHVLVAHPNASRRHGAADCPRLVRSVNTIERVAEIHCARAQRIVRAARHEM